MLSDIRRYFVEGAKDEVYRLLWEIQYEQARITDISLTNKDAEEIITVAALARGEIIDFTWDSFTLPWFGRTPELEKLANGGVWQFLFEDELSLEFEGRVIPIGRVRTHIRSARLADPEATRRDLASEVVPTLRLVPGDSDQGQRTLVPKPQ